MPHYAKLSLIDDEMVKELNPILDYCDYYCYTRDIFSVSRIEYICDALMEILDVNYDNEMDFHVLNPELIDRIISGLEERQGMWSDGLQLKSKRLIDGLKEHRNTFAFEGGDSLLLSWAD